MCGMLNVVIGSLFWHYLIRVSLPIIARGLWSAKCKQFIRLPALSMRAFQFEAD